jgi:hypothetical protein
VGVEEGEVSDIARVLPKPINMNALFLALLHWTPSAKGLYCSQCYRNVAWDWIEENELHCVQEHRFWCRWRETQHLKTLYKRIIGLL